MRGRSYIKFLTQLVAAAVAAVTLSACERPFVEPERPNIEVLSPDLTTILQSRMLDLEVRVRAARGVEHLEVNGDTLTYDPQEQVWVTEYELDLGLNRLVFAATDVDDNTTLDTVYAMHNGLGINRNLPHLPEPRGGHTATLSDANVIYVIGGTSSINADALGSVFVWRSGEFAFDRLTDEMEIARTGHTASSLPDGRILILGGSRNERIDAIQDLVETAEIFDPASETFRIIPTQGAPIRRAYHTASLHRQGTDVYVDLYGGRGDIRYGSDPTLGTRRDLRRFIFRNDSLIAVSPAPGPNLDFAAWGHTQTPLRSFGPSQDKQFLVAGTGFTPGSEEGVSFLLDYSSENGIAQLPTAPMIHPRTRHASSHVSNGFVAIFGGHQGEPAAALNDVEVYSEEADRYFTFPPSSVLLRRFGLSATKLADGRILLVGGYFSAGQGATTTSVVSIPTF